jgi:hypothetical protein
MIPYEQFHSELSKEINRYKEALQEIELHCLFPKGMTPQKIFNITHKALHPEWTAPDDNETI